MSKFNNSPTKSSRTEPLSPSPLYFSRSSQSSPTKPKPSTKLTSSHLNLISSQALSLSDLQDSPSPVLSSSPAFFSKHPRSPSKLRSSSPLKVKIELNKVKLHRFACLFKLLNPNTRSRVLYSRAIKSRIDIKLEQILLPIFENLAKIPLGITYREFCCKLDILMKYLNDEDKYFLLSPHLYTPSLHIPNRHRVCSPERNAINSQWSEHKSCLSPFNSKYYP